jgi:radical SAM superfamily enzyme YgiQ (UPF0313 family)
MRILLIDPCTTPAVAARKRGIGRFPQVSLQYIAALTPAEHEVSIVEEETQPIDLNAECDLVGITCMTATAPRAYALADELRRRGRKVVLGGVHPTVLPEEAAAHADAVVIGEAEPVWATLLADAARGALQPVYRSNNEWALDDYPTPRRELSHSRAVLGLTPAVTSRGCPYACDFCCVRNVFGRAIRHVSVERVMDDIDRSGASRVMFLDDNIVGDPRYADQLFTALEGRGIQWVGQASVSFVRNEQLLKKAARSGCKGLFIGLESVSETKMARMQKSMKSLAETEAAIRRITQAGILFHASIVFGFDDDEPSIFDQTLEFMYRTSMSSATFNILTPYPGTVLFDQFRSEGRLLTTDWSSYDHCTPTFMPRNMTIEQLTEGCQHVRSSFSSLTSIAARFPANWRTPLLYTLINIGQRVGIRQEMRQEHGSLIDTAITALKGFPSLIRR